VELYLAYPEISALIDYPAPHLVLITWFFSPKNYYLFIYIIIKINYYNIKQQIYTKSLFKTEKKLWDLINLMLKY
jgi:hypothetical protein